MYIWLVPALSKTHGYGAMEVAVNIWKPLGGGKTHFKDSTADANRLKIVFWPIFFIISGILEYPGFPDSFRDKLQHNWHLLVIQQVL